MRWLQGRIGAAAVVALAVAGLAAGEAPPPAPKTPKPAQPPVLEDTKTAPTAQPKGAKPAKPRAETAGEGQKPPETPQDILDMTNFRYVMELAQVHLTHGALERAEEMLRKAQAAAKDPAEKAQVISSLAALLQRKLDYKGAAACYEQLMAGAASPSARAQFGTTLADMYKRSGELATAEKVLLEISKPPADGKEAPGEDTWRKQAWQQLMSIWRKQEGKLEQVVAENEEALAKNPQDIVALERLGELYGQGKQDPAKAAAVYEKLVAAKPQEPTWLSRLASAYQENKQYEKGVEVYRKLLAANPNAAGSSAHHHIAQLLLLAGKKDEAVAYGKEHLSNEPIAGGGQSMLESFLEQAGMQADAEEAIKKQIELAKTPQAKADCMLRLADQARRRKDYAKAEEQIRTIMATFTEDKALLARAKTALVRLYEEQGRMHELKF